MNGQQEETGNCANQTKFDFTRLIVFLIFMALGAAMAYVYKTYEHKQAIGHGDMAAFEAQFSVVRQLEKPEKLNDFKIYNEKGRPVAFKTVQNKPSIVNLWATWCAPCVEELGSLDRLKAALDGEGIEVIALSVDSVKTPDKLLNFFKKHDLKNLEVYYDEDRQAQDEIPYRGLPTTLLINKKGEVTHVIEGQGVWDSENSQAVLKALLKIK